MTALDIGEAKVVDPWRVNARGVKKVPGRAKGRLPCRLVVSNMGECGLLRASFLPPEPIRQPRDLTRTTVDR